VKTFFQERTRHDDLLPTDDFFRRLLLMPLTLYEVPNFGWNHIGIIPATVVISFFLLGIEELGIQLEEPFSVL
jgi:predicted membrane chloride channel (bestrophin family)